MAIKAAMRKHQHHQKCTHKEKNMTQQAPSRIKTHLALNKQANKSKENKNGNQDALSHHAQLLKVLPVCLRWLMVLFHQSRVSSHNFSSH
jgi:hypothetical protein